MIRFSAVAVPFAAKTVTLAAGATLSTEQTDWLVARNGLKAEVALVVADKPTRLRAQATFRAALVAQARPATVLPGETLGQLVRAAKLTLVK